MDSPAALVAGALGGPRAAGAGHVIMACLGRALRALARRFLLAVLTTNHVVRGLLLLRQRGCTGCWGWESNRQNRATAEKLQASFDCDRAFASIQAAKYEYLIKLRTGFGDQPRPALGDSWAHQPHVRVQLSRGEGRARSAALTAFHIGPCHGAPAWFELREDGVG